MTAPERIWAMPSEDGWMAPYVGNAPCEGAVEYVRADLATPAAPLDGGSAFPSDMLINGSVKGSKPYCGMSLRDWFAGQALAAWPVTDRDRTASALARKCYTLADAMIAARDAKP